MTPRGLWAGGAALLLVASLAAAQTVYTWRDDKGVVHFSDENPEGIKNVEKLTLEQAPPLVTEGEGGEGAPGGTMVVTPGAGAPGAKAGAPPAAQEPSGPPQVAFISAELSPAGETSRNVRGKVQNVGGSVATNVSVRVVIADGDTGNLCTTGEINAEPRDLGAGEFATFVGELRTPCFYGNPTISYYPEWD